VRALVVYLLRCVVEWLDPVVEVEEEPAPAEPPVVFTIALDHLAFPAERSEPLDAQDLWRGHVTDGAAYVEENDVYRLRSAIAGSGGGGYL
jgi:hypothetical protein